MITYHPFLSMLSDGRENSQKKSNSLRILYYLMHTRGVILRKLVVHFLLQRMKDDCIHLRGRRGKET